MFNTINNSGKSKGAIKQLYSTEIKQEIENHKQVAALHIEAERITKRGSPKWLYKIQFLRMDILQ